MRKGRGGRRGRDRRVGARLFSRAVRNIRVVVLMRVRSRHVVRVREWGELVLAGAVEHDLPADYVAAYITSVETVTDPKDERDRKERSALPK